MSIVLDGSNQTTGGLINSGTAQASTSGTAITFTGIPSTAKRITVMLNGVSTNGTSAYQVQIGSGSVINTGYLGKCVETTTASGTGATAYTSGFIVARSATASTTLYGKVELDLITGNTWLASGVALSSVTDNQFYFSGSLSLSGALDRVVITTVNGTDTFDAGSINIFWE